MGSCFVIKEERGLLAVCTNKCEPISSRIPLSERSLVFLNNAMHWNPLYKVLRKQMVGQSRGAKSLLHKTFTAIPDWVDETGDSRSHFYWRTKKDWIMNNWRLHFCARTLTFFFCRQKALLGLPLWYTFLHLKQTWANLQFLLLLSPCLFFVFTCFLSFSSSCSKTESYRLWQRSHLTPWSWTIPLVMQCSNPAGQWLSCPLFPLCLQDLATASPSSPLSHSSLSISPNGELSSPRLLHLENPLPYLLLHLVRIIVLICSI